MRIVGIIALVGIFSSSLFVSARNENGRNENGRPANGRPGNGNGQNNNEQFGNTVIEGDLEVIDPQDGDGEGNLTVEGMSHLSTQPFLFPNQPTSLGSGAAIYYEPVRVGRSSFFVDMNFKAVVGSDNSVPFGQLPLGLYENCGQVKVTVSIGNFDNHSATWALQGSYQSNQVGTSTEGLSGVFCLDYQSCGDANQLQLYGVAVEGDITLYLTYPVNYEAGDIPELVAKVEYLGGVKGENPVQEPSVNFDIPAEIPVEPVSNNGRNSFQLVQIFQSDIVSFTGDSYFERSQFFEKIVNGDVTINGRLVLPSQSGDIGMGIFGGNASQ